MSPTTLAITALALLGSSVGEPVQSGPAWSGVCKKEPGLIAGPFVPDKETALAIFHAVERVKDPYVDKKRLPVVEVSDEGATWVVWRTHRAKPLYKRRDGTVVFRNFDGGGGLEVTIDKCSGAMSAHYSI